MGRQRRKGEKSDSEGEKVKSVRLPERKSPYGDDVDVGGRTKKKEREKKKKNLASARAKMVGDLGRVYGWLWLTGIQQPARVRTGDCHGPIWPGPPLLTANRAAFLLGLARASHLGSRHVLGNARVRQTSFAPMGARDGMTFSSRRNEISIYLL